MTELNQNQVEIVTGQVLELYRECSVEQRQKIDEFIARLNRVKIGDEIELQGNVVVRKGKNAWEINPASDPWRDAVPGTYLLKNYCGAYIRLHAGD